MDFKPNSWLKKLFHFKSRLHAKEYYFFYQDAYNAENIGFYRITGGG